jgi:hypothetical protein
MCNLYSMTRNVEAIRRLFRVPHNRATAIEPLPANFPGWTAPVIRKSTDGDRHSSSALVPASSYCEPDIKPMAPTLAKIPPAVAFVGSFFI